MIELANFEPVELGLPEKFTEFRPAQVDAIEKIINSDKRFVLAGLPTGTGKTLVGMGVAQALGARSMFVTSTLGLQNQYLRDFGQMGLTDIRGKSNYQCSHHSRENCKFAKFAGCPHITGEGLATKDCTYGAAKYQAMASRLVISNYSYWIRVDGGSTGLSYKDKENGGLKNPFELLVLDEAHRAPEELSRTLQLTITETVLKALKLDYRRSEEVDFWFEWAQEKEDEVAEAKLEAIQKYRMRPTEATRRMMRNWDVVGDFVEKMVRIRPDSWVCEIFRNEMFGSSYVFNPIWPANWSEKLFFNVPKIVLMSATLRPYTARMLGIPKDEYEYHEWPRVFPAHLTPVIHIETTRMRWGMPDEELDKWVARIDEIIGARLGRKGLIHTKSYDRAKYLKAKSKYSHLMILNSNDDAESSTAYEKYMEFKEAAAPAVLVSPSFSTGWDFPDDMCRYQIIAKLPFISSKGKLVKARLERNPQYVNMLCMQELEQAIGRGTRHEDDWCEVFIVDDMIRIFMAQHKSLGAPWLSIRTVACVPVPIEF